jgi:thiol-disulfide isomerase/thioredoxin
MNYIKTILFLILIAFASNLNAQSVKEVIIEGDAPFAKGENIRLIVIEDYVTFTHKTVATSQIDNNGHFKLSYHINHNCLVQLAIRNMKAEFHIVPQHTYQFRIKADSMLFQLLDPAQYGGYLEIETLYPDTADLNLKINRFSRYYGALLDYFGNRIIRTKERAAFDSLTEALKERFPVVYNPTNFYETYIYYTYAQLDAIFWQKNADSIYHLYLNNEYLLYDNPAYMAFFNRFYQNYLYNSHRISKPILGTHINETPNYKALFNEVGKDLLLANAKIRELVIVKNLGELYGNSEFDKKNILKLLQYVLAHTTYPEHKPIIENIMANCTRLADASALPEPHFTNAKGRAFSLQSLRGKWLFLHFFDLDCQSCITEMLLLKDLHEKYHDSINFVSISLDANKAKFIQFVQSYQSQFAWDILHFNGDYNWLNEMDINSLPDYILIYPNGRLAQRYFHDISTTLSLKLLQMFGNTPEIAPVPFLRPRR